MASSATSSPSLEASGSAVPAQRDFSNEEDKTQEALTTFINLEDCKYASKYIGNAKSSDFMECDCYEEFEEGINHACDENSDCINRLTLIECVNGLCDTCGDNCQNQRFQKKEYADISVFKTKMKGYGVRANKDIEANDFIYEYKGEVIEEDEFRERLIDYDERGFKHFYFMMLQNAEFIDATIKGSLARFCNHSCNPNAYVNKWVVAGKLKMGIFAKRDIYKGEEITFDYNVDRYGATAQKCYCEEPNCIGFLGGKTQTDSASLLPQSYADALGVKVSVEKKWIREMKAKGLKIDKSNGTNINISFVESLSLAACESMDEVTKVMSVLLQIDDEYIGQKLLSRLFMITDESLLHQVIKFHGYRCFAKLLQFYANDIGLLGQILEFLDRLPKTTKNGITSSGIDKKINDLITRDNTLYNKGEELLEKWNSYETYNRISKKDINEISKKATDVRRIRLPPGWEIVHENGQPMYYNAQLQTKLRHPPSGSSKTFNSRTSSRDNLHGFHKKNSNFNKRHRLDDDAYEKIKMKRIENEMKALEKAKDEEKRLLKEKFELENQKKSELTKIIEFANKQKELEREQSIKEKEERAKRRVEKKQVSRSSHIEHKWNKFFASVVPNLLKKYENEHNISHEHTKHCSREIVKILTSKELKKDPSRAPDEEPTKEKRAKIRDFTTIYMDKFIQKYQDKKSTKHA
ncbi:hypothetical protein Kpol_2001p35 [Vanderwaltozyma polyspora DSM 70294]|uniref:Histone-lysine N-methyltransferase, H3 lysine-36 specific n=1 Tax=Vanderwaltozyma polyspora (strain ATCC 22028 / DSM 70294 / BCRC 21397 / CBS 2163 / NBRC 10782 / NRRL Y-8283 / UCD 57-17) TaxID=436907 RepID=A7TGR7_VANPO|nr:uncharacterized protein Kpol_2001p35 [Vanderwaltozyma polyspora DSM 70294]EDO18530.1 hypothetical protein Kpol_2001p35 [Vanderwaltozyma polyspora DSM 70294]